MSDHSSPANETPQGYTEAEGYAASLRQQADWIEESREGRVSIYMAIGLDDIDTDELRAAADFIELTAIRAQQMREQTTCCQGLAPSSECRCEQERLAQCVSDPLADLVDRFSKALLAKLRLAGANGRSGWERDDWEQQCQQGLLRHIEKGDPRDVAAYCVFMWHHGWITAFTSPGCRDLTADELSDLHADAVKTSQTMKAAILPQRMRETAAEAIRTFCKSLGNNVVVVSSDDVERIYYSGISVDALSAAIAIALTRPECGGD